ncbi:hypothetical protein TcG_12744, partial [Trypanosoma cruzi]
RATRVCGAEHTFLPSCFVFFAARRADTCSATHTATPCRRCFSFILFVLFDGCVLPPCVSVDVGPYRMYRCHPAVPLAVLMCLPVLLLFAASPSHADIRYCTVLCRIALGDGGTLACIQWRDGEAAAFLSAVGITVPLDGCVWEAFCVPPEVG